MAQLNYGENLPPGLGIPAHMKNLFQRVDKPDTANDPSTRMGANQHGPSVKSITKGSLIHFKYGNFKHDPNPLIIVTDIFPNYIRGINLHYLTFNYIKRLLKMHCDNQMFSYFAIKQDRFFVDAFRSYKRLGVKQPNKLDCSFLLNTLAMVRSFDPAEVEQMRVYVKEQLRRQVNPKAEATQEKYMGRINQGEGFQQPQGQPPNPQQNPRFF